MKKAFIIGFIFLSSSSFAANATKVSKTVKPIKNDSISAIQVDTNLNVIFPNPFLFFLPEPTKSEK